MKAAPGTPVRALGHDGASRTNIPTAELESFVKDEEKRPAILRYPRDPTLDPQLVWKGKDEQDGRDLEVPAVPIYIQETIDPLALIEDLRSTSEGRRTEQQLGFFGPYGALSFDEKVDFYRHAGKWSNRMILGDSLLVMTSLAEKEGLKGQVQTIYIDPPYGIKFGSNWQVSTRKRDVRDGKDTDLTRQPEQVRAYRDTWELGIHSYLSYLRDRLVIARELLTESGSVFVQIGDENVHVVRTVLDEVFGSANFVSQIAFKKTTAQTSDYLSGALDYLLLYAKSLPDLKYRRLFHSKEIGGEGGGEYQYVQLSDGSTRRLTPEEVQRPGGLPPGARAFAIGDLTSQRPPGSFPVEFEGQTFTPKSNYWKTGASGMTRLVHADRIVRSGTILKYRRFFDDFPAMSIANYWVDTSSGASRADPKIYAVQTTSRVIQRCLLMTTDPGDLVLDPTCGSGTTAYVAEQWGRRWITVDTSRVALALARSRLMAAKYPWYLLADSEAGVRKEAELSGQAPPTPMPPVTGDVRRGFVYERLPHVTLKSIAQNPDIREGMTREEIDAAIARHAETEILFDRPYEDRKVVRVSGPFTVESLSPHRVIRDGPEDEAPDIAAPVESVDASRFVSTILDNLRRAGVQNTKRDERLELTRLDPYPGTWIQGVGEYLESGKAKTAAIAIGPEFGTVGPELIRDAAKEAVKFADLLVMCGFAFDPLAGEEASSLGRLTILQARMNPDLAMGDELLKKTGTGNLFMVFGEPDIDVREVGEGQLQVEIRGLDVYDPTTGALRSSSVDDIAAWFLDTDYDGDAFFVRHAYFTGADDPYDKLRRALRADISDEAWGSVNSTVSRPFPRPRSGKIAIKVINHYGDEVLKVMPVGPGTN